MRKLEYGVMIAILFVVGSMFGSGFAQAQNVPQGGETVNWASNPDLAKSADSVPPPVTLRLEGLDDAGRLIYYRLATITYSAAIPIPGAPPPPDLDLRAQYIYITRVTAKPGEKCASTAPGLETIGSYVSYCAPGAP